MKSNNQSTSQKFFLQRYSYANSRGHCQKQDRANEGGVNFSVGRTAARPAIRSFRVNPYLRDDLAAARFKSERQDQPIIEKQSDIILRNSPATISSGRGALTSIQRLTQKVRDIVNNNNRHNASDIIKYSNDLDRKIKDAFYSDKGNYAQIKEALKVLIKVDRLLEAWNAGNVFFVKILSELLSELSYTNNSREINAAKEYASLFLDLSDQDLTRIGAENIYGMFSSCGRLLSTDSIFKKLIYRCAIWINQQKSLNKIIQNPVHVSIILNALGNVLDERQTDGVIVDAIYELARFLLKNLDIVNQFSHPKDFALTLNALTKLIGTCRGIDKVVELLAVRCGDKLRILEFFDSQDIICILNALGKMANNSVRCRDAIKRVVDVLVQNSMRLPEGMQKMHQISAVLGGLLTVLDKDRKDNQHIENVVRIIISTLIRNPQNVASVLNEFGRLARNGAGFRYAIESIAKLLLENNANFLKKIQEPRDVACSLNGLAAEIGPDRQHTRDAIKEIAKNVAEHPNLILSRFIYPRHFSLTINVLGKFADDKECQIAIDAFAKRILKSDGALLKSIREPQNIALILNGLSALAEVVRVGKYSDVERAIKELAKHLNDNPNIVKKTTYPQQLSLTINALGKFADDKECQIAIDAFAKRILKNDGALLKNIRVSQDIALTLNGLSALVEVVRVGKCPNVERAIKELAKHLNDNPDIVKGITYPQDLSLIINALGKFADDKECREAIDVLAGWLNENYSLIESFQDASDIARILRVFSRLLYVSQDIESAVLRLMACARSLEFGKVDFKALIFIARALSHLQPILGRDIVASFIRESADHFIGKPDQFKRYSLEWVQNVFRTLVDVQEYDRILSLFKSVNIRPLDIFKNSDIETLSNLAYSLSFLLKNKENLSSEEREVSEFLQERLLPILKEKISNYFSPSSDPVIIQRIGPSGTRYPAASFIQLLTAYHRVKLLIADPNKNAVIENWLRKVGQQTEEKIFSKGLTTGQWNLLAEVDTFEADIDYYLKRPDAVSRYGQPAEIEPDLVFNELGRREGLSAPEENAFVDRSLPEVDIRGRSVSTQGVRVYSIFDRLTDGKLPIYYVRLPGNLGKTLLGRIIYINNEPYRMDGLGGSSMKNERPTLESILNSNNNENSRNEKYGKLIAVPVKDTLENSPFLNKMIKKLFPYKESFYYFKRALIPSTPSLKGTTPRDFVLEGRFRIGMLPDDKSSDFRIVDRSGREIKLRPCDGGGFIRQSAARKMPGYVKSLERHGRETGAGENVPTESEGNLPAQALQHYPRAGRENRVVRQEAAEKLQGRITQDHAEGRTVSESEHFRYMTAGKITGRMGIAVPSSDNSVHIPNQMGVQSGQNVLLGRAPYDKPNLLPIGHQKVATSGATAEFLSTASAMQYTYVGRQDTVNGASDKGSYFFAKGVLTIISDEFWPEVYKNQDMVISAEDVKSHSTWVGERQRVREKILITASGFLVATDDKIYLPGELIAVPPGQQKRLDGDYDGDHILIISDRPALYDYVKRFEEGQGEQASLKPPKTHTPAVDSNGRYQYGRSEEILAAKGGTLESYSGLQMQFLAQPKAVQEEYARRAVIGIFEGMSEELYQRLPGELSRLGMQGQEELLRRIRGEVNRTQNPDVQILYGILKALIRREQPPAISAQLKERFPVLFHEYGQATRFQTKWQAVLRNFPIRRWPESSLPPYHPNDPVRSIKDFLTLGIKVGTDSYKSRTAVDLYQREVGRLRGLFHNIPKVVLKIPYGKGRARGLSAQRWSLEETQRDLRINPTLAGEMMEVGLEVLNRNRLLPQQPQASHSANDSRKRPEGGRIEEPPNKRPRIPLPAANIGTKRKAAETLEEQQPTKKRLREELAGVLGSSSF